MIDHVGNTPTVWWLQRHLSKFW